MAKLRKIERRGSDLPPAFPKLSKESTLSTGAECHGFSVWLRWHGFYFSARYLGDIYELTGGRTWEPDSVYHDLRIAFSEILKTSGRSKNLAWQLEKVRNVLREASPGGAKFGKGGIYFSAGGTIRRTLSKSEGLIESEKTTKRFQKAVGDTSRLPAEPSALWDADFRGKSKLAKKTALLKFLDDVYGGYFPKHRDKLRDYIRTKNPELHAALKNYGFDNLPEKFKMPSRDERLMGRLKKAADGAYEDMSPPERRSIRGKLSRLEQKGKKTTSPK
jgi:hypothetical protein